MWQKGDGKMLLQTLTNASTRGAIAIHKGLTLLTDATGDGTVVEESVKWYEDVNEFIDKPEVQAVAGIGIAVVLVLTIWQFGIKKLIRRARK